MNLLPKIIEYKIPGNSIEVLEVGYGEGREATRLAELGCLVDAVDPQGIKSENDKVTIFPLKIEEFNITKKYNLILAQNVFYFIPSPLERIAELWSYVERGGFFAFTLLGEKDEWVGSQNIFSTTKEDIQTLLQKIESTGGEVYFENEEYGLGNTKSGNMKKWHIYSYIIKKSL